MSETAFKQVSPNELQGNVFRNIGEEWMLVTAVKPDGSVNTMTASWGGMGIMWGMPVFTCVIRPQRYTFEFTEASGIITLSFFGGAKMEQLSYLGSVSGREEDKIAKSGLTLVKEGGAAYFAEASQVLVGRKLYSDFLRDDAFADRGILGKWYNGDLHKAYVCEITKALVR